MAVSPKSKARRDGTSNEALSKPCLPTDLLESAMRLLPPI